jgi:NAD(P)-dependent dehydrogenase (short-subunit alcohol dehydrogenase family)
LKITEKIRRFKMQEIQPAVGKRVVLVTGGSAGLGAALVEAHLAEGDFVIALARRCPAQLANAPTETGLHIAVDFSQPEAAEPILAQLFEALPPTIAALTCYQNAGVVTPLSPVGQLSATETQAALHINLTCPLLLSNLLVARTQAWPIPKRLVFVSSGAAHNPVHGWSVYCTSKAALLMHTRCLAAEQATQAYPILALSIAPGVVDTDMQTAIRNSTPAQTQAVGRFIQLKTTGQLLAPAYAARQIIAVAHHPKALPGEALDIRTFGR